MKDGRDAVGDGLPIAFEQRNVDRKSPSRPRHHLSLEGVAVDVDDPGKDQKAAGVDHPLGARLCADAGGDPGLAIEIDSGLLERAPTSARPASMRMRMTDPSYERAVCS